jgi:hypothetical protein
LRELAALLLSRPIGDLAGKVHTYKTLREFEAEYLRRWPHRKPPLGYFDPNNGELHLSPNASLHVALHETVHKVTEDTFRFGPDLLGDFLEEGITEAVTRARIGPYPSAHLYDTHVAFVELLQRRLGPNGVSIVENAALHGEYASLRAAVKQLFGGSEERTFRFFTMLRKIGRHPDPALLRKSISMLDEAAGVGHTLAPAQNLRVVKGKPPQVRTPRPGSELEPREAPIPEGLNLHGRRATKHPAPYSVRYPGDVPQEYLKLRNGRATPRPIAPRAAPPVTGGPLTRDAIMGELRRAGTPEGAITAGMLASGERVVTVLERDPDGASTFAGTWRYGTKSIEVYADRVQTPRDAAQTIARLVRLSLDNVAPEQLHRGHELAAELWALRAVDADIGLETAQELAAIRQQIDRRFPHLPAPEPQTELPPLLDLDSLPTDVRQWLGYTEGSQ